MMRVAALAFFCLIFSTAPTAAQQSAAASSRQQRCQCTLGTATWYGAAAHGRRTAGGEFFDRHALTAAHRTLPFNTRVHVTNLHNGRSVVVRITDRGRLPPGRVIDLSEAAARELDMIARGIARVRVERLGATAS